MGTVEVSFGGGGGGVGREERVRSAGLQLHPRRPRALSQTKQCVLVGWWQGGGDLNVLLLEGERVERCVIGRSGVEQNFSPLFPRHCESEGILCVVNLHPTSYFCDHPQPDNRMYTTLFAGPRLNGGYVSM